MKIHPPDFQSTYIYPVKTRSSGQNTICTSHYTVWNFVFLNLIEQFCRLANIFFLVCAIMQAIPVISSLDPVMGFLGLGLMLGLSMLKAGYEDYRRHVDDKTINNKLVTIWKSSGECEQIKWMDVQPGDILIINNNESFPADCIIVDTSSKDNRCRIQTAALDGETDLKYKRIVTDKVDLKKSTFFFDISIPEPSLSSFNGSIILANGTKYYLTISNFVPRGCILKQTQFVSVLVVYTGENTKIIMNSSKPRYKRTEIDRFLSKYVIFAIIGLLILSVILTILSYFYIKNNLHQGYLQLQVMPNIHYFWNIFSWILIINNFIPLSLYSSLDIVRFFLSLMITNDPKLSDDEEHASKCRNSDLVYTIGRITHIFSDKTGTLTKNLMTFKIACFRDIALGLSGINDEEDEKYDFTEASYYSLDDITTARVLSDPKKIDSERLFTFPRDDFKYMTDNLNKNEDILFFLYTIVFCNNAMTSVNPTYYDIRDIREIFPDFRFSYELPPAEVVARFPYIITYLTSSPDELCLIHIARECGFILYESNDEVVKVIINGQLTEFSRPITFDYTSKRRRGSCITKINGKYYLLMKGADSTVSELCVGEKDILLENVQLISENGIRTLVYAVKEIKDIESILNRYTRIGIMNSGREEAFEELSKEIEKDLKLIAVSGVEDELQNDVELSLRTLKMANIKVWMLTGDKLSTALNIGKTTELISSNDNVIIIKFEDSLDNFSVLKDINYSKTVIVLEGSTFAAFLTSKETITSFFKHASLCSGVIVARCEPSQKGNVVRSFKEFDKECTVLAIGDGANDVDMIRAADVGVGVEGKEGSEAVNSSDFSIPSFRHITSLLIVHGRWCVNRVTLLVGLTLYKTSIIAFLQIYYGFYNGFSATSTFDSAFLTVYSIVLTIPQLFVICVLEQNLSSRFALAVPHIYKENQTTGGLSFKSLAEYYTLSILHSIMMFFFSYFESNKVILNSKGMTFDYAIFTQITGWTLLFVFTFVLLTRFKTITILHVILYAFCVLFYLLVEFVYSYKYQMFYAVVPIIFSSPRIWFTIPICVGSCLIIDLVMTYFRKMIKPPLSNAVAELEYAELFNRNHF